MNSLKLPMLGRIIKVKLFFNIPLLQPTLDLRGLLLLVDPLEAHI